jgi:hypothetical protein
MVGSGYRATIPNSSWVEKGQIVITCMFDREDKLNRLSVVRIRLSDKSDTSGDDAPRPDPEQMKEMMRKAKNKGQ